MRYETFDSEVHDVLKVAKLVYDVDFRTFDMLFKNPDGAVKAIAKDLRRNEIEYYFKVIFDDNDEMIAEKEIFAKVHAKLADYGFILRYLEGKEDVTGYGYEPWHFRYIQDVEVAKEIMSKGLTLEEYLENK